MKTGDTVLLWKMPGWVDQMPEETRNVMKHCIGHSFRISGIDRDGLFVLDVSSKADKECGGFMNEVHIEKEFLKKQK